MPGPVALEVFSESEFKAECDTEPESAEAATPVEPLPPYLKAVDTVCLRAEAVSEGEMKVSFPQETT